MRGTQEPRITPRDVHGIIPAYAGNTCRRLPRIRLPWDHPRVCGEHDDMPLHCDELTGSSPRMRGTPADVTNLALWVGIIPAYAGNTSMP